MLKAIILGASSLMTLAATSIVTADQMKSSEEVTSTIIAMEKEALSRWCTGDPDGFLEISAPDVVYFDPIVPARIDGRDALKAYYDKLKGKRSSARFDLLNPLVQVNGNMAVLTYNYVSQSGDVTSRWNCTEVYRYEDGKWRIIQTHWSLTTPNLR